MNDPQTRTILGVDPGSRRFGIAIADLETRFARPLETVDTQQEDPIRRVTELAREHSAAEVVVGKPISLSGHSGPAANAYKDFVAGLEVAGLKVTEYDERLTTVIAEQGLRSGGAKRGARKEIRDAVAAQVLLQSFLDVDR